MLQEIIKVLNANKEVSAWKIIERETRGLELFFIKKNLDMNRSKKVKHMLLTLYHDFKEDREYRGSVSLRLHPTYTLSEIESIIEKALFSARYVKNEPYPLAEPGIPATVIPESRFASKPLESWLAPLTEALFKEGTREKGGINSAELFLNHIKIRILNSAGVDVAYDSYKGDLEIIAEWHGKKEDVELYKLIHFSDFFPEKISETVKKQLLLCRDRAQAKATPSLKVPVLLTGDPVKEFFNYYLSQSAAENVYKKISTMEIGRSIQGERVQGDKLNIRLEPYLIDSVQSAAWDSDGLALKPVALIEQGILTHYWGPLRFTHYLNCPATGNVPNVIIREGTCPAEDIRKGEYLEVLSFSDFQCDPLTGDFGGEIRLAKYAAGNGSAEPVSVTGGSISGNIRDVQHDFTFSKEIQVFDNFQGPETIRLNQVNITGAE
jgi:PmbA protein